MLVENIHLLLLHKDSECEWSLSSSTVMEVCKVVAM